MSKLLLEQKFVENQEMLTAKIKEIILELTTDSKELLNYYDNLKKLVYDIIDIADQKTNTGIVDIVDSPIAKLMSDRLITPKLELWWDEKRADLLAKLELLNG